MFCSANVGSFHGSVLATVALSDIPSRQSNTLASAGGERTRVFEGRGLLLAVAHVRVIPAHVIDHDFVRSDFAARTENVNGERDTAIRPQPKCGILHNPTPRWAFVFVVVARRQVAPPRRTAGVVLPPGGELASSGTQPCRHRARCSVSVPHQSYYLRKRHRLGDRHRPAGHAVLVGVQLSAAQPLSAVVVVPVCVACMQRRRPPRRRATISTTTLPSCLLHVSHAAAIQLGLASYPAGPFASGHHNLQSDPIGPWQTRTPCLYAVAFNSL